MKRLFGLLLLLLALLVLAGCSSPGASQPVESAVPTVEPSPSPVPPTLTPSPSLTASITPLPPNPTLTPTRSSSPTSSATPTALACWSQGGYVETASLEIPDLRYPLDVRVYLPPCYLQLPEQRFPVLYLVHGQSFNDDQWDRLGVDEEMDALVASGDLPPFIIVMPRDREWSQSNQDPFAWAFMEHLLPWVDASYRTLADRRSRAVGGLSRGAGWAVHFGLKYWEEFGAIGGHSLPVFWSDVPHIKTWLKEIPPESLPRLYLDLADQDRPEITQSATWFEELLTREGIPHEFYLFPGFHDEAYWSAHVQQYLRWYAADW